MPIALLALGDPILATAPHTAIFHNADYDADCDLYDSEEPPIGCDPGCLVALSFGQLDVPVCIGIHGRCLLSRLQSSSMFGLFGAEAVVPILMVPRRCRR